MTTGAFFGFISRVIQTIQNVCMMEKSEKTNVYWWMEEFRFNAANFWFWCSKVFLDYKSCSRLFDVNVIMWFSVLPIYLIIIRRFLHFAQCMYYCSAFIFYFCFYVSTAAFFSQGTCIVGCCQYFDDIWKKSNNNITSYAYISLNNITVLFPL